MASLILKTVLVALGCLVAADIAGALTCTIVDILPLRGASPAFAYAVWLVFGIFCGLFTYSAAGAWSSPKAEAGDWTSLPGAGRIGTGVFITSLLVIVGVGCLFYTLYWSRGVAGEEYVPDSESHSLVFLGAVVGAIAVGRFLLMPTPDKPA